MFFKFRKKTPKTTETPIKLEGESQTEVIATPLEQAIESVNPEAAPEPHGEYVDQQTDTQTATSEIKTPAENHQNLAPSLETSEIVVKEPIKDATTKTAQEPEERAPPELEKNNYFSRLRQGLSKTSAGLGQLFLGKKSLDDDFLESLETALLQADVGIDATQQIIDQLLGENTRQALKDNTLIRDKLQQLIENLLKPVEQPLIIAPLADNAPFVILMVGINGAGKTTTIGKLAQRFKQNGHSVMLAAGDTFRAAAVEQLVTWGERASVPVIAQGEGADSASVIFDAYHAAKARKIDVLIADTAGRLHTQNNLMDEIKKVVRVLKKACPDAPHEVMLVIDAGNGQNALNQVKAFHQVLGITGLTVTKLDGTAKGGILLAMSKQLGLPIRFIGVGEHADDLNTFDARSFSKALLANLSEAD